MSAATGEARFTASFLQVGQGQATIVADVQARQALVVDCGAGSAQLIDAECERLRIEECRLLIISHLDLDHCGDLARVLKILNPSVLRVNADTAWKASSDHPRLRAVLRSARDWATARSIRVSAATDESPADDPAVGTLHWRILAPRQIDLLTATLRGQRNDASVVVHVTAGGLRILLCADAEATTLQRLVEDDTEAIASDVVAVPHHGGKWGTRAQQDAFYAAVGASHAVVSTGSRNSYGHPHPESLSAARRGGESRVLCTEVTPRCFGADSLQQHQELARSEFTTAPHLACAATVSVEVLSSGGWRVVPSVKEHANVVDSWPRPMCRLPVDQ